MQDRGTNIICSPIPFRTLTGNAKIRVMDSYIYYPQQCVSGLAVQVDPEQHAQQLPGCVFSLLQQLSFVAVAQPLCCFTDCFSICTVLSPVWAKLE